jgi:hypothetical protein
MNWGSVWVVGDNTNHRLNGQYIGLLIVGVVTDEKAERYGWE